MFNQIGWFGYPGKTVVNKTHIVDEHERPICKIAISYRAEFQVCAHATSKNISMVECKRCRKVWASMNKMRKFILRFRTSTTKDEQVGYIDALDRPSARVAAYQLVGRDGEILSLLERK